MKERQYHIILFSVLFAVVLWASVNLTYDYQSTISVPLVLDNMKGNRALLRQVPPSVEIKLQGTGWQLLGLAFMLNPHYVLDISDVSTRQRFLTTNDVSSRVKLPPGVRVLGIKPDTIAVILDQRDEKMVLIAIDARLSFRPGYDLVGKMQATPESVSVSGPASLLSGITEWKTKPLTLDNLHGGVTTQVDLTDTLSYAFTVRPTAAAVSLDIQPIAERTFKGIPVEVNEVPENRMVLLLPPTVDVVVRGGVDEVATVNRKDFSAYIAYRAILLDTTGALQPVVNAPKNVRIVALDPPKIQYVVRK